MAGYQFALAELRVWQAELTSAKAALPRAKAELTKAALAHAKAALLVDVTCSPVAAIRRRPAYQPGERGLAAKATRGGWIAGIHQGP